MTTMCRPKAWHAVEGHVLSACGWTFHYGEPNAGQDTWDRLITAPSGSGGGAKWPRCVWHHSSPPPPRTPFGKS